MYIAHTRDTVIHIPSDNPEGTLAEMYRDVCSWMQGQSPEMLMQVISLYPEGQNSPYDVARASLVRQLYGMTHGWRPRQVCFGNYTVWLYSYYPGYCDDYTRRAQVVRDALVFSLLNRARLEDVTFRPTMSVRISGDPTSRTVEDVLIAEAPAVPSLVEHFFPSTPLRLGEVCVTPIDEEGAVWPTKYFRIAEGLAVLPTWQALYAIVREGRSNSRVEATYDTLTYISGANEQVRPRDWFGWELTAIRHWVYSQELSTGIPVNAPIVLGNVVYPASPLCFPLRSPALEVVDGLIHLRISVPITSANPLETLYHYHNEGVEDSCICADSLVNTLRRAWSISIRTRVFPSLAWLCNSVEREHSIAAVPTITIMPEVTPQQFLAPRDVITGSITRTPPPSQWFPGMFQETSDIADIPLTTFSLNPAQENTNVGRRFGIELEFDPGTNSQEWYFRALRDALREVGQRNVIMDGYRHSDGSTWDLKTDSSCGLELATPALRWNQFGLVDVALKSLREAGAIITPKCGVHIHHECANMRITSLRRMLLVWHTYEDVLFSLVRPDRKTNEYCQSLRSDFSFERLRNNLGNQATIRNTVRILGKYRSLNTLPWWNTGRVEVRMHHGTLQPNTIRLWTAITQNMVNRSRVVHNYNALRGVAEMSIQAQYSRFMSRYCNDDMLKQAAELVKKHTPALVRV